jgi:hypothetical protein
MEQALNYLANTDEKIAEYKSQVAKTEYLAKLKEAFAFKAAEGDTVKDREVSSKTDVSAQESWQVHFQAVVEYEKLSVRCLWRS